MPGREAPFPCLPRVCRGSDTPSCRESSVISKVVRGGKAVRVIRSHYWSHMNGPAMREARHKSLRSRGSWMMSGSRKAGDSPPRMAWVVGLLGIAPVGSTYGWATSVHCFRLVVASVSVLPLVGCSTAYHARLRSVGDPADLDENITHCLASVGLEYRGVYEPTSIWSTPPRSFPSTPGSTALVQRQGEHWSVIFVPTAGGGSEAAEVLSDGFARCIELHVPGVPVQVQSKLFFDLR